MTDSFKPEPLTLDKQFVYSHEWDEHVRDAKPSSFGMECETLSQDSDLFYSDSVRAAFEYALNVMRFYEKNSVDSTATAGVQLCIDALKEAFPVFKEVEKND